MKSGELNKPLADKAIVSAQHKVKVFRRAYFARTNSFDHLPQLQEFHRSELGGELETANARFGNVLKRFAEAVGAEWQEN